MINARSETLLEKPSFRQAVDKRRCLVPANGFYEWRREGKRKVPMWIQFKTREPFAFPGLWDCWIDRETGKTAIQLHDHYYARQRAVAPHSEELEAYEVSTLVNSPENDSPECVRRIRNTANRRLPLVDAPQK